MKSGIRGCQSEHHPASRESFEWSRIQQAIQLVGATRNCFLSRNKIDERFAIGNDVEIILRSLKVFEDVERPRDMIGLLPSTLADAQQTSSVIE